jgi:hypothetical protein
MHGVCNGKTIRVPSGDQEMSEPLVKADFYANLADPSDTGMMSKGLNRLPSKVAIVTSAPPAWRPLTRITWHLQAEYAHQHGYHFFTDESEVYVDVQDGSAPLRGFIKFEVLWFYLPRYEWVVWLDSDLLITNKAVRLESFIKRAGDKDLVLGYDHNGHNTTIIMMRNCPRMRDFLFACNGAGRSMFLRHPWHEMESMRYFLQTPPYKDSALYLSVKELCPILHSEYERYGMPKDMGAEYAWEPGDFSMHLSALSLERRAQLAMHYADPARHHNAPPITK